MKPYFTEKGIEPIEEMLENALGESYRLFVELVELTALLNQEWKFYSPKYGWSLKVFQKKKVLCYLTPGEGCFSFGMALRKNEKDLVLNSEVSENIKKTLSSEKKLMEGYPLRIKINNRVQIYDINNIIRFINKERNLGLAF